MLGTKPVAVDDGLRLGTIIADHAERFARPIRATPPRPPILPYKAIRGTIHAN